MNSVKIEEKPGCIQCALAIIGDKWTALLIREFSECPKMFSELEGELVGISPRTLSQRLSMLETEGIVEKERYCERPPRYKYQLTEKGTDLQQVLMSMAAWGEKYATKVS